MKIIECKVRAIPSIHIALCFERIGQNLHVEKRYEAGEYEALLQGQVQRTGLGTGSRRWLVPIAAHSPALSIRLVSTFLQVRIYARLRPFPLGEG